MQQARILVFMGATVMLAVAVSLAITTWPKPDSAEGQQVSGVAAGGAHSCALTLSGGVKCWGWNQFGQLGDGTQTDRTLPVDVIGLNAALTSLAAGNGHTCGVTSGGGLKCWGRDDFGQVGGGGGYELTPISVPVPPVTSVAAGLYHTCALTTAGGVLCWGNNEFGQLGDGTTTNRSSPATVSGLGSGIRAIGAGDRYTCAALDSGSVKCWGNNTFGALGTTTSDVCTVFSSPCSKVALTATVLSANAIAVDGGWGHTCVITAAGGVQCWGWDTNHKLGCGSSCIPGAQIQDVQGLDGAAVQLAVQGTKSCVVVDTNSAQCWGAGYLGDGTSGASPPVQVLGIEGSAVAVDVGGKLNISNHACSITLSGNAFCWGSNGDGQIGDGQACGTSCPAPVIVNYAKPTPTSTPCAPEGCPTPTETATNTSTNTPTVTPTPCPGGKVPAGAGCGTPTPTPTVTHTPTVTPTPTQVAGMSLHVPDTVVSGAPFKVRVDADPQPTRETNGIQTEIQLPAGLTWQPRASCLQEVKLSIVEQPLGRWSQAGPAGQVRHVAGASCCDQYYPFVEPLGDLVEIDVTCTAPGLYRVALRAYPPSIPGGSAGGALYFLFNAPNAGSDYGYVFTTDMDGEQVADFIDIDCIPALDTNDTDSDGCSDLDEIGPNQALGGKRDPIHFWDFFDSPTGPMLQRDKSVAGTDFFALLSRFGANGDPEIDPLSSPPSPPVYHTAYDRGPAVAGSDPWDLTAANGSIAGTDFFAMLAQFGHSCA